MHNNQTGCFPATSSKGNQYIMVLVEVDRNYINAEPMKNKSEGSIIKAYLILWTRLMELGTVQPIDRNCDLLPLSLDDLLNYTTLMLKFCTNKWIWALLLRQVCF